MKILKKRVCVTYGDIKRGVQGDTCACPIAKALNRQHKQRDWQVSDSFSITSPYGKNYKASSKDEDKVDSFIKNFDDGKKVRPISFTLIPQ